MELNTGIMSSMNLNSEEIIVIDDNNISSEKETKALKEVDENEKFKPRRSQRKRIRPLDNTDFSNDGGTKMQKLSKDANDIEKYYLSKKVKRLPSALETIFEEPKQLNNQQQYVSTKKFKRSIKFHEDIAGATKLKLRKRQLKAKKLPSSKAFLNRKKVSMDTLLKKLSGIESDKE